MMQALLCLLYILTFLSAAIRSAQAQNAPTVSIAQGEVVGVRAIDGVYDVFYGIPYAGSVSSQNRFKAPPPPPDFNGTFIANDTSIECAQPSNSGVRGVEDCLVLDIHTKSTSASNPVMVWLHGGHYTTGSNQGISFQNIVKEDIVVVALNYRLSIFGFLCLRVPDAPGNAGLHDVIAGLRWVKDNIAAFGGDPNNIVLSGHGSGAAMVDLITLQPQANGLVHKAIAQSGSSLSPWAIAYEPIERAMQFGERLGYANKSVEELATEFINTDLNILLTNLNEYKFTDNSALFAPCLEDPSVDSIATFMSRAPINILRSGSYNEIPFLTGYTSAEGSIRATEAVDDDWLDKMEEDFIQFLQPDLAFSNETVRDEVANSIKSYYFPQRIIDNTTTTEYIIYHGDTMFSVSIIRAARERAIHSADLVRLYEFDFEGTFGEPWPYPTVSLEGARHGHELNYLFIAANQNGAFGDNSVSASITRRWTLFAHTGIPVAQEGSGSLRWSPVTPTSIHFLAYRDVNPVGTGHLEISSQNPHLITTLYWFSIYANFYRAPEGFEPEPQPEPEPETEVDQDNGASILFSSMITLYMCQILIKII